ncbi:MAG: iron-sulfur cluster assembly accessory protein [Bacteroidetes bacterium]|nr:iron-sulfur cluster assembly accessory protein [Bacteroidota bacterium]
MEAIAQSPINISPSAIKELKRLMGEENFDENNYLRIGVKNGGCSGMSYILGFEPKEEKDTVYETGGILIIINPAHLIYLANMAIDWEGGLSARGFTFSNPNASTSCGCGSSFAV